MESSHLFAVLARLQRRGKALGSLEALLWCVTAIAVALLVACWLDLALELSPGMRVAAVVIALLAGAAASARMLLIELSRSTSQRLARQLDALAATGGQILAGVDLAALKMESLHSPQPLLSAGLATIAVERAGALAARVPPARVLPWTAIVPAGVAAAIVTGLMAAAAIFFPGPAQAEWLRFSDPFGDHPPYSWVVFRVEPGATRVRYGDGLDVFVTLERGVADAVELVLQPPGAPSSSTSGERVPMFQEPSGRWRASLAEIKDEVQYFVRARRARSPKFSIEVLTVPQIERAHFRVTPPAYSRLPVYEGGLPQGGVSGLVGTQIEVRVTSNRPLRSAHAKFASGEQILHKEEWKAVAGASEVTGSLVLERTGRLDIQVVDIDGQPSRGTFSASLTLLADERPFVRLQEPRAVSLATPSSRLPVVISAEDDFGVARLELFRSLNESRYLPVPISLPQEPPRRTYQPLQLPLHDYGLAAGDEIKLFARVEDNDPAGAKGAESPAVTVRIISEEEFAKMVRARDGLNVLMSRYQESQRRIESLAADMEQLEKQLAALPADSPLADEMRSKLQELAEQMSKESGAIRELAQAPLPFALDQQLSKNLERLADKIAELAKDARSIPSSASNSKAASELAQLRQRLQGEKQALDDETGLPLELMKALYPLIEDEARFAQLYQRQRDLVERLSALRGRDQQDDPALKVRMRDLEAEQQRIQADLAELVEDIDGHAKLLLNRPEFKELAQSAEVFAMLVRRSEADTAMSQAAAALAEFSGTEAYDQALRAADILESFLAKCQSMGGQAESGLKNAFEPGLSESIGDTIEQLLADGGYGLNSGGGTGAGGGYSARRNSLANIGLYGGLPGLAGRQAANPRSGSRSGADMPYASDAYAPDGAAGGDPAAARPAAGSGEASVPLQYRRKVGQYFQRLADELGSGAAR